MINKGILCDAPILRGPFFFFLTTVRSLLRQRNLCHDRGSLSLSCTPNRVYRTPGLVVRAWPSLSCATKRHTVAIEKLLVLSNPIATSNSLSQHENSLTKAKPCCDKEFSVAIRKPLALDKLCRSMKGATPDLLSWLSSSRQGNLCHDIFTTEKQNTVATWKDYVAT